MKNQLIFILLFMCAGSMSLAETANTELRIAIDGQPIQAAENGPVVSYADVLDRATSSVVAVYTSQIVASGSRGYQQMPEILRQFGFRVPDDAMNAPTPRERRQQIGVGSGVIVSDDGYILTNHHVIQGMRGRQADEIRVQLSDGVEYDAELVGSDEKTDVAVLKIEANGTLPSITLADSDKLRVGDVVFAIGNPLDVGLTATQGIVSATGRDSYGILGPGAYENFIQTDAAINLGNSGGALIDAWGRLIGINTAIVSRSGGSIGIGFAIPANMALNIARNLINSGGVPRGMLGLFPTNLDRDMADAFGLETTKGALVNQVQPDAPAARAGIQHGDIIIKVDDIEIESAQQLRLRVSQMLPGSEVIVTLIRQGETLQVPVTLGSLDGMAYQTEPSRGSVYGMRLNRIDQEVREHLAIPAGIDGVVVEEVSIDSPFAGKLEPMMIILEVNGEAVDAPAEVESLLQEGMNRLYIWAEGQKRFIVMRL